MIAAAGVAVAFGVSMLTVGLIFSTIPGAPVGRWFVGGAVLMLIAVGLTVAAP